MKPEKTTDPAALDCPSCGRDGVKTTLEEETFGYGVEPNAVSLSCTIPVRTCTACGYRFTDAAAEERRHEAVCRHLQVMTPAEVMQLRKRYGLSRADFGRLTRIGEASVARWETGVFIQNAGYDSLLYLLRFSENVDRLGRRFETGSKQECGTMAGADRKDRFRAISNSSIENLVAQASQWQLTPGAFNV